jgi:hypothetical protein
VLTWAESIDLTTATSAQLTFASRLSSGASSGSVQVSVDGVTWQTVASAPPTGEWTTVGVDLGAFAGRVIDVRFVFDAVAAGPGVEPDVWTIGDVSVTVGVIQGNTGTIGP